jgi:hypothetical protein
VLGVEQRELRREVLLHVGVVVEVVVAEVEERHDVEDEPVHAVVGERLRAHLDRHRTHLALAHAGEHAVHLGRLGRRERARHREVADLALGGRAEPRDEPQLAEDAVQQVRDRGLAVGARDAEQQRWMLAGAVDPRRDRPHGLPRRLDEHDRQARVAGERRTRGIGQQRDRAQLPGLRGVRRPVAPQALHAHVQVAGAHVARVDRDAGDLDGIDRTEGREREVVNELGERSRRRMLRSQDRGVTTHARPRSNSNPRHRIGDSTDSAITT